MKKYGTEISKVNYNHISAGSTSAIFTNKQNDNKITSFTFPESITNTTSFMVTLVSAMFVDNICKENNKYPN